MLQEHSSFTQKNAERLTIDDCVISANLEVKTRSGDAMSSM
jgi:hypothetical protein